MPRVIGIDPGTLSIDLCGLDDGRLFLDVSLPNAQALADPATLIRLLDEAGPIDLVAGPSGYGLPLVAARDVSERHLRLAYLAVEGEPGGIGGLRSLMRALAGWATPVVLTPGVIHLPSVPVHRKANRVDLGTADKVCAAVLAVHDQMRRLQCPPQDVHLILLELGGAFSATIAVEGGRIVDGAGGSSGPLGIRAAGALDGEVAFLAGAVTRQMVFGGGADAIAGEPGASAEMLAASAHPRATRAWEAYLESAVKAVMAMMVAAPAAREVTISGRVARLAGVREEIARRLQAVKVSVPIQTLTGFASTAKQAAQGAALLADGLTGGPSAALIEHMGIRAASGTVLDHLFVISPSAAKKRLGLP